MLIDTARNGNDGARVIDCKAWCNLRGAALGNPPTAHTALPGVVDAYFWIKTPGESDGCTAQLPDGSACARFDPDCAKDSSLGAREGEPRAPEAGVFYDYQALQLARRVRRAQQAFFVFKMKWESGGRRRPHSARGGAYFGALPWSPILPLAHA